MSLLIDPNTVSEVLLVDGWHNVKPGSFDLDSYELGTPHPDANRDPFMLHKGGQSGISATGFTFTELSERTEFMPSVELGQVSGPFSAVLALRHG